MSIRDKRLKIEIDNVIKKNLERGYVPTASEVVGDLTRYLIETNLSGPSYKFSSKSSKFTATDIEAARESVLQDLSILYGSLVDVYQAIEAQIEKFSTEKSKCDYKLATLESKLTSMISKHAASGYTLGYKNTLTDAEDIDLSKTDADIDITHHSVTLKRLQDIPFDDFVVSVSSGNSPINQNGDINTYIHEKGVVWQGIIEKDTQQETVLEIDIDTKKLNLINKIELDAPMLKKSAVSVYTSLDRDKWAKEYTADVLNRTVINISNNLRYIKIVFSKLEADKFILGKYQYYFLIDAIKLSAVNYATESVIISKPIKLESNIDKVSISTEQETPPGTSIRYYVATTSAPNWIPISTLNDGNKKHSQVVSFNTVEPDQRISIAIPSDISNDAYELKSLSVNGQHLYSIAEVEASSITNYKLYKGMNAWKVEKVNIAVAGPQTQAVLIQNTRNVTTSYRPVVIEKPGLIMNAEQFAANTVIKFSTTIQRDSGDIVLKEMVASSHPITIYLNGKVIYSGLPSNGTYVTYPFNKGLNVLSVIANVGNAPINSSLDLNLNIFEVGSLVCANKDPMKSVPLFDLRYNTNNQYDAYTLYNLNGKYAVIVKDPDLSMRYDLIYDSVIAPTNEILVKAVLKREYASINISPTLSSYEVRLV